MPCVNDSARERGTGCNLVALGHFSHKPVLESAVHHQGIAVAVLLLAIALQPPAGFEDFAGHPPLVSASVPAPHVCCTCPRA